MSENRFFRQDSVPPDRLIFILKYFFYLICDCCAWINQNTANNLDE
jgi:hypothetical protein